MDEKENAAITSIIDQSALLRRIDNDFIYHAPKGTQADRYERIREMAHGFARSAVAMCPPSREVSTGLTHLETAVMFFNAAIARNE